MPECLNFFHPLNIFSFAQFFRISLIYWLKYHYLAGNSAYITYIARVYIISYIGNSEDKFWLPYIKNIAIITENMHVGVKNSVEKIDIQGKN